MTSRPARRTVQVADRGVFAESDRFAATLAAHGLGPLVRAEVATLQVNVGKRCNQACHHCHVEAGPRRTESMSKETAERVVALLERSPTVRTVDITGGAPELNPHFRWLVAEARRLGREVIDRCNLTILFEPGMEDLPDFLARHRVRIVASLPCYLAENVDRQRGPRVFDRSIDALLRLNAIGYGRPGSPLRLDLVYNPAGASLPPPQERLAAAYRDELGRRFGIEFHDLLTLNNMPIHRFADFLERTGQREAYMSLLVGRFNPETLPRVMCRSLMSVGWDGRLYDCDFHQVLEIEAGGRRRTVRELASADELAGAPIATRDHCFGCTAGAGSSCGGALR